MWQVGQRGHGRGRALNRGCRRSTHRGVRALGRCYWTEAWTGRGHGVIEGASLCARERRGDGRTEWRSGTRTGAGSLEDEGGVCQAALVTAEWRFTWMCNSKKRRWLCCTLWQ